MKNKSILVTLFVVFIILSMIMAGCAPQVNQEVDEIPEIIDDEIHDARFFIQADSALQEPVAALYEAIFMGESPVFVDEDADLMAVLDFTGEEDRPVVPATFLPDAVLIPVNESQDVQSFIDFAISPEGQQILIDLDFLPEVVIVTDQAGNSVEIPQPVYRVISAYGPATALVYSVGAGDRLVSASYLGARDPQGAAAMERIDPRFQEIMGDDNFNQDDFNIEQAALLEPDLVLTSARADWLDVSDQLDISVFLFEAETPDLLMEAVLLTGQLFGPHTTAQAEAWVSYYEMVVTRIASQTEAIPEDERPQVLFTGTNPLRVASGDMLQTDIIEFAGGVSVSAELFGFWNDVNMEQIAIWDPEVIIVPPYGGASVEAITESPEWQILDSVQAGFVYRMPKLVAPWDTPAPDSVLGIIWMAQLLNPDLVDLDCSEETQYFYNTFYNYAITVDEIATLCVFD